MYKHFVGVKNQEELKVRYRELAKKHHPDKGGSQAIFVEVTNEYNKILGTIITFPISNDSSAAFMNGLEDFIQTANRYAYAQQRAQKANRDIWEEIKKQRPLTEDEIWQQKKQRDENLRILEDLVDIAYKENKTNNWFLAEMFKLDDLILDHFKFVRYQFKKICGKTFNEYWVFNSYQNYIAIRNINWEVK